MSASPRVAPGRADAAAVPYEQVAVSAEDGLLVADNGQELRRYHASEKMPAVQLTFDGHDRRSSSTAAAAAN